MTFDPSVLDKECDDLGLSVRSRTCLNNNDVITVRDWVLKTKKDLLNSPNFGPVSLSEMMEVLGSMGLCLGMTKAELEYMVAQASPPL